MNIPESEWKIMEALWGSGARTASELTRELQGSTSWAENTVRTLLTRLVRKKALRTTVNPQGTRVFVPKVSREQCVQVESESFLDRVFQGAAKPLLVHFVQNSTLSAEEVKELKRLLDQSLKDRPQR